MSVLFIIIGFVLLVIGGEFLVRSSVAISLKLDLSRMVIGLTVVSFATSAPELLVSLQAALDGYSDMSLGNVIGSNIANIGLVLGITAMISPLLIDRDFVRFNWPIMMLFSFALYFFLFSEDVLSRIEGVILLVAILIYVFFLIRRARNKPDELAEEIDPDLKVASTFKTVLWLAIGGLALYFGSELLVDGAVDLASAFGISERVISVTMIAVGTSIPELAASVIAAVKKEKALSLGNLIGSNIFNIASVLGVTAMIQPVAVKADEILTNDIFWMIGIAFVLIPLAYLPTKYSLGRLKGFLLVGAYAFFVSQALLG